MPNDFGIDLNKTSMKIDVQLSLLAKLGSMVVHAEELFGRDGHHFDRAAMEAIAKDPEVKKFVKQLQKLALVPVKRKKK